MQQGHGFGTRLTLTTALCAVAPAPLFAQSLGVLRGVVLDDRGSPIAGATVTLSRAGQTTAARGAVTSTGGLFQLAALQPARDYEVSAVFPGYSRVVLSPVEVAAGGTSSIQIVLPRAALVGEHIEVKAHPEMIDADSTT